MSLNLLQLEAFFGSKFEPIEHLQELRFHAGGMHHRLWLDETRQWVGFTADPSNTDVAFPAIEFGFKCDGLSEATASGVGPVLLFHCGEEVRLGITKTKDGVFSLSPNWHDNKHG